LAATSTEVLGFRTDYDGFLSAVGATTVPSHGLTITIDLSALAPLLRVVGIVGLDFGQGCESPANASSAEQRGVPGARPQWCMS
jgi:hypothetical protein